MEELERVKTGIEVEKTYGDQPICSTGIICAPGGVQ